MPSATRFRMGSLLVRGIALLPGILVVLTTIGLSSVPVDASAAESWGYDLKYDLMSPFCPGRTLASCTSPQAAELAQWILVQEAAGATREEVLEILLEEFCGSHNVSSLSFPRP